MTVSFGPTLTATNWTPLSRYFRSSLSRTGMYFWASGHPVSTKTRTTAFFSPKSDKDRAT